LKEELQEYSARVAGIEDNIIEMEKEKSALIDDN